MEKSIRRWSDNDYKTMLEWYKEWDEWTPPKIESIPKSSTFVLCVNQSPVAVSSYYETNSNLAMLGATIKSRKYKKMVNREDIKNLLETIKEDAKQKGYDVLFYATDEESKHMVKNFEECGGIITDKGNAYIASMPLNNNCIKWLEE